MLWNIRHDFLFRFFPSDLFRNIFMGLFRNFSRVTFRKFTSEFFRNLSMFSLTKSFLDTLKIYFRCCSRKCSRNTIRNSTRDAFKKYLAEKSIFLFSCDCLINFSRYSFENFLKDLLQTFSIHSWIFQTLLQKYPFKFL